MVLRCYLSVVTIAKIRHGVAFLDGVDSTRKASMLDAWATGLADLFADRIIPLDQGIAERAGNIFGRVEARGHQPGLADACIAATADVRGLTVITRNVRHFRLFDVPFDTPVASDRMS